MKLALTQVIWSDQSCICPFLFGTGCVGSSWSVSIFRLLGMHGRKVLSRRIIEIKIKTA